ncbi:hypothetical protein DD985_11290, partial [Pseudomonas sp. HMWF011]|uniref:hypothetical protein n=1 Tax=Pseudomonas sp. HMWF011 TaxID=2056848 RepID=UPI000D56CF9C
ITGRAVEAFGAGDDKVHGGAGAVGLLVMRRGWVQKFYLNAGCKGGLAFDVGLEADTYLPDT